MSLRGMLGNCGELHDAERRLKRDWKVKAWVTCQLSYKGWNREPLMRPGRYTELFFLDSLRWQQDTDRAACVAS
jgi:hypothetical protein